jgi:cytoskeletal protein CcmA (bactofilin family)
MALWQKQPESQKNPATSPGIPAPPRVELPVQHAPIAPPRAVPTSPAHLMISHTIKGEITGREDLYVDGEVQGSIYLEEGKVTVGPNGRVTADVEATEIIIMGRVNGNLRGRERVHVGQTGTTIGDILTSRIFIEEGAEIHGTVEVIRNEELGGQRITSIESAGELGKSRSAQSKNTSTGT